ncbi:pantetheine-phosphate adenylyltransferase [Candidatus Kinetoplastibacterium blastocrithidii TCC012E]|uniref:Phosphopantetheine adenylyltransferase n=1 Tax=Candidatus Kinetoplastidibacterium blastocrithidiae TCC012E TaxID=1208922 RepID=M1LZQ7_9PROT|nr:pantetheine-phosphate adenylyltransferase [Candidatus Kinetoplastibacterium blastocrithidii]AFZ83455.1 phosphopantetheine adenylyltransferase [Candidatus Kinetoplastibacterium blastocrithidii (ex Strigomonas culicis)]AGF49551.1 pantetheine-phosphate adenylyltransferase [Candidatus Kinetoplastibacterium blastocrithidii TCC012E]
MITAIYPGTFDPLTLGHENIILRASKLFDKIIVGIAHSKKKYPFFKIEERVNIASIILKKYSNVEVESFDGLLKDFVHKKNAKLILRGLRTTSDFEYEFQMAGMNRQLMPDIETFFMITSPEYQYISGSIVREIAKLGGDISKFVCPYVENCFQTRKIK